MKIETIKRSFHCAKDILEDLMERKGTGSETETAECNAFCRTMDILADIIENETELFDDDSVRGESELASRIVECFLFKCNRTPMHKHGSGKEAIICQQNPDIVR